MPYIYIILLTTVLSAVFATPQNTSPNKPNLALPTEDLTYIIKIRNGEDAVSPKNMSPCARAILGCCNGTVMDSNCSENLKCGSHFFDINPCDEKFLQEALQAARQFYEQFNKVTK